MWIATVAGAGFAPVAPGTVGSAVGVVLFVPLASLGTPLYLLTTVALTTLGIWASDAAERAFGRSDDGRIVIDELAGQLLCLLPLVPVRDALSFLQWISLAVTGFVLFRVLDIAKPGPIGWAERGFHGGTGVMADDVVAGLLGAMLLALPTWWLL